MTDAPRPHQETTAVTAGRQASADSLAPVLCPSTTYTVDTIAEHAAMVSTARPSKLYARFGSPTVRELEDVVAELEGAEAALAAASGMASVTAALLGICSSGDHIVATRQIFSVTYGLLAMHLPRFGIAATLVDGTDPGAIAERSEEHTSDLQSLMRISYAVFCMKKKKQQDTTSKTHKIHQPK